MTRILLNCLQYAYLGGIVALFVLLVHVDAQSQSGFISIDCGKPEKSSYTDTKTGLTYVSDSAFTDVGVSRTISLEYYNDTLGEQFYNVRSFPQGDRNCYVLKPEQDEGTKYLIRARFLYGNYDGKNIIPSFVLYLGANKWGTVDLDSVSSSKTMEIIHIPSSDYMFICLVNTGKGTPFISSLELRPLRDFSYTQTQAAILYRRLDIGSQNNKPIRYKDDVYDRLWEPFNFPERKVLSTSLPIEATPYQLPSVVMSTAMSPANSSSTSFSFFMLPENPAAEYFVYMHFAEVEKLEANQSREFNIYQNGELWRGPISPTYLSTTTLFKVSPVSGERIDYELYQTETSTHPPTINALEVYIGLNFSQSETAQQDADAMIKIKSKYGLKKNWQGDPCAPKSFMWDGLNCSFGDQDRPLGVISLNLSSSGLTGNIASYIPSLTALKFLDLSNNSLTGPVPDFLSKLQFLKVLNLKGNKLSGSIPVELIKRSNTGSLLLSVAGNPSLCSSLSCHKKTHKYIIPVVASASTLLLLLIAFLIGWKLINTRKQEGKAEKFKFMRKSGSALEPKNHQFAYSDITAITNNFEEVIGKGGFGIVYHGYLNDTQVAVKMLSASSAQGYKEFQAEVKLLMRVHHINLTSLIGYCYEDNHMGLIYEYMANGNLGRHISDKNANTLSWEDRLQIAVDTAQGLEYLHHGCKPPIVHRDVKPANILLNEKFQAKLADFGLSRAFPVEGGTHVTTTVAGTPGYLDPEYFKSSWLNEKSDVFSFGVVLLEMITGRPVVAKNPDAHENSHISQWVETMLEKGEIENIVDPRLQGDFQISSALKAVEIAIACVRDNSLERPRMNHVVVELNECLALEIASKKDGRDQTKDSVVKMSLNLDSDLNPSPR